MERSRQLFDALSSVDISNKAFDKFEWLFVIPAKAGIHGSPIKAFGDDKFELPLEFIEQRTNKAATETRCKQYKERGGNRTLLWCVDRTRDAVMRSNASVPKGCGGMASTPSLFLLGVVL